MLVTKSSKIADPNNDGDGDKVRGNVLGMGTAGVGMGMLVHPCITF